MTDKCSNCGKKNIKEGHKEHCKRRGKDPHKIPYEVVFPPDPNEGKEDKRPVELRKKPKVSVRVELD